MKLISYIRCYSESAALLRCWLRQRGLLHVTTAMLRRWWEGEWTTAELVSERKGGNCTAALLGGRVSCTASQQRCWDNEWERDRRLSTTVSKVGIECAGWERERGTHCWPEEGGCTAALLGGRKGGGCTVTLLNEKTFKK